jgi:hypothetical protein
MNEYTEIGKNKTFSKKRKRFSPQLKLKVGPNFVKRKAKRVKRKLKADAAHSTTQKDE